MCCLFKDVLFVGLGDCGDGPPLVALGTEVARGEVPRTQMVALGLASAVQSTPEFGLLADSEPVSAAHARSELADRDTLSSSWSKIPFSHRHAGFGGPRAGWPTALEWPLMYD